MIRSIRLLTEHKKKEQERTDKATSTCETMHHNDFMKELEEAITVLESYHNIKRQILRKVRRV